MSTEADLNDATVALAEAAKQHAEAAARTATARCEETSALNTLNKAQRRFDELVAGIKKAAPRDSDWHRAALPRQEVSA